jgi:hypothetical protein
MGPTHRKLAEQLRPASTETIPTVARVCSRLERPAASILEVGGIVSPPRISVFPNAQVMADHLPGVLESLNAAISLLERWNVLKRRLLAPHLAQQAVELEDQLFELIPPQSSQEWLGQQLNAARHVFGHGPRRAAGKSHGGMVLDIGRSTSSISAMLDFQSFGAPPPSLPSSPQGETPCPAFTASISSTSTRF